MVIGYMGFPADRYNFVFRNGQSSKERDGGFRQDFQAPSPCPGQLFPLCSFHGDDWRLWGSVEGVGQEQRKDGDVAKELSCRSAWQKSDEFRLAEFRWSGRKNPWFKILIKSLPYHVGIPLPLTSSPQPPARQFYLFRKGKNKGGIFAKSGLWIIEIYFQEREGFFPCFIPLF